MEANDLKWLLELAWRYSDVNDDQAGIDRVQRIQAGESRG